jgi:cytochrome o ubiquinol oxidase subunit II
MLPAGVPIKFDITADAPMNSFWIPALGGQIYAMTGMDNPLFLRADEPGTYQGLSANYSGEHFADMHFTVHAVTQESFDSWIAAQHIASTTLNMSGYTSLAQPGTSTPIAYGSVQSGLFDAILSKYAQQGDSGHHH